MLRPYLIGMGFALLLMIPIVIVGGLSIGIIKTELWNEAPKEMAIVQNGMQNLFNGIGSFIITNWFYIFIVLILSLIAYILFRIWEELYYKPCK